MTKPIFSGSFSIASFQNQLSKAKSLGYSIITCRDWVEGKQTVEDQRILVLRVDIDENPLRLPTLLGVLGDLDIKCSIFLRLHGNYNPFSFENYNIFKSAVEAGHEIGYHSEVVDQSAIWGEDESECLKRDLDVMESIFGQRVVGAASHGGRTGLNNLDFWKRNQPSDFRLLYEAYDETDQFGLFRKALYISDSEWVRWKCYRNGILQVGDHRSVGDHLDELPPLIYLLVHPETFYQRHPYE